jgi:hypothetical protein
LYGTLKYAGFKIRGEDFGQEGEDFEPHGAIVA